MSTGMSGSGQPPERKTVFDPADRARLRAALIGYMRENDIGVPTLIAHIASVAGRGIDIIPQKTLQRFLAGSHRTNDGFLIQIDKFAATLPPAAPATLLGEALSAFLGRGKSDSEDGPNMTAARDLAGTYTVFAERIFEPGPSFGMKFSLREGFKIPVADAVFDAVANPGFLMVRETLFNPHKQEDFVPTESSWKEVHEGVALSMGLFAYVFLKNNLTQSPRTYWLQAEPDKLTGYLTEFERVTEEGKRQGRMASAYLQFRRQTPGSVLP